MKRYRDKAIMENLENMIQFILKEVNLLTKDDKKFENKMRLVCEEAFVNVISYAYGENIGDIELKYDANEEEKSFVIMIIDEGVAFDPLKKEDPDLTLSLEERPIGGLGIFMVKNIMDKVSYKREGEKNILILEKRL